jgi:hypothetical protein
MAVSTDGAVFCDTACFLLDDCLVFADPEDGAIKLK